MAPKTKRVRRTKWPASQEQINPAKVVFIFFMEETQARTNMTRRYGRSLSRTSPLEKTPCGRWRTTTSPETLRAHSFVALLTVNGAINGTLFRARIEQHLAPTLPPGDVEAMDNLSNHKAPGIREVIEAAGLHGRYRPAAHDRHGPAVANLALRFCKPPCF